jgi:hypothetical protein
MRPGWETHYSGRCAAEHGYPNWTRPAYLHKGPRRLKGRNFEAGHTTAPDHMPDRAKKMLAFMGASTHVRSDCPAWSMEWVIVSTIDSVHLEVGCGGEEGSEEAGLV